MFDFGLRIRTLRERYKMSQEELGRKVGRSKSVISSYENNVKIPSLTILTQLAVIFNVSLDYLVGIDKTESISLDGLTAGQKDIIRCCLDIFRDTTVKKAGLSERELKVLDLLMKEFYSHN